MGAVRPGRARVLARGPRGAGCGPASPRRGNARDAGRAARDVDYVEAHGDCMRQLGRHPSWCKMVMVKGLRAPHSNPLSNPLHGNPGWEVFSGGSY